MYVGVFKRFIALLLDLIIVMGLFLLILFAIQFTHILPKENTILSILTSSFKYPFDSLGSNLECLFIYYIFSAAIWLVYEIFFVCSSFSGTPGKIVLGLEIACYKNASILKAFIRSFTKVISIFSVLGLVIEAYIVSKHRNSQSLHDMASFTLVRRKESESLVESKNIEMIFNDFEEGKLNSFEDIMDLKSRIADNKQNIRENHGTAVSWLIIILAFLASASIITTHFLGIISL